MNTKSKTLLVSLFLTSSAFSAPKCSDQDLENRARHMSNALVAISEKANGPVRLVSVRKNSRNGVQENFYTFTSGKLTSTVVMNAYPGGCDVNSLKAGYAF